AAPAPVVLAAPQAPPSSPWSSYAWPMATLVAGLGFLRQLAITWRLYKKLGYHSRSADPGPLSLG
ncbi:hypothetical protein HY251_20770, partial [bacterium]|nr:hypothetical protein [bacterium]